MPPFITCKFSHICLDFSQQITVEHKAGSTKTISFKVTAKREPAVPQGIKGTSN